jgi:hypothetical protein
VVETTTRGSGESAGANTNRTERWIRVTQSQQQIQSGTLTAGSFDDVQRFDDYRKFVTDSLQQNAAETLPRLPLGDRAIIHVRNSQRQPVGSASVIVQAADAQSGERANAPPLVELVTGNDGRTMFLAGIDGPSGTREYRVSVTRPGTQQQVTRIFRLDGQAWQIVLPRAPADRPRQLDLALVIDTTGSMGDELEYLKAEIDSIARTIYRMFPDVDQRYALVLYRDEGDQYVTRSFDFTGSLEEFRSCLSRQSAGGGGDYPEAVHLALERAGELAWRKDDTARVAFLVGDAPPHDRYAERTLAAGKLFRGRGIRVFPVASSGVELKAEFVMRAVAFMTLGQYLFLTDHSGVGLPHAEPHVPEYQVERLDNLMIRMIAAELTGKRLNADELLAIETGNTTPGFNSNTDPPHSQSFVSYAESKLLSMMPSRWAILVVLVLCAFGYDAVTRR